MRKIIYTIFVLVSFLLIGACRQAMGPIPPVAWPNETPEIDQELPLTDVTEPSAGVPSGGPSGDTDSDVMYAPGEGGPSEPPPEPGIEADPAAIYTADYTDGIVTSDIISTIKIATGELKPDSGVDIWATAVGTNIVSPPYIWGEDLDPEKPKIQGLSWPDGSLEFKIIAGYSPGLFTVHVSDGDTELSTSVTIRRP